MLYHLAKLPLKVQFEENIFWFLTDSNESVRKLQHGSGSNHTAIQLLSNGVPSANAGLSMYQFLIKKRQGNRKLNGGKSGSVSYRSNGEIFHIVRGNYTRRNGKLTSKTINVRIDESSGWQKIRTLLLSLESRQKELIGRISSTGVFNSKSRLVIRNCTFCLNLKKNRIMERFRVFSQE